MTELERKKKQFELSRVSLAKEEMELKILEREDEINKLRDMIKKQETRELELKGELNG